MLLGGDGEENRHESKAFNWKCKNPNKRQVNYEFNTQQQ